MPKNTGMGGNKRKKGKKQVQEDRELRIKEEGEEYAQITKILGDGRFQCKCADGIDRVAHLRGKFRKRVWLGNGDIILVSLREFEPEKCDIVEKYKEKEVAKLKKENEIPESMVLPSGADAEEKDEGEGDIFFQEQEDTTKKKENSSGFDIESENDEEEEKEDEKEKEDIKDNEKEEVKEDEKEKEDKKDNEKEEEDDDENEKGKKNRKDKKDKDRKRKNNRDKKKSGKGGGEDDGAFNIDDI